MSRGILWAGEYEEALGSVLAFAEAQLKVPVEGAHLSMQTRYVDVASYFPKFLEFFDANRLRFRPFDLLIFAISNRAYEYAVEPGDMRAKYRGILADFRHSLSSRRLPNGRSLETVPVLLTSEFAFGGPMKPDTLAPNLYLMPNMYDLEPFAKAATSLVRSSFEVFRQSLEVVGYGLVPEGEGVTPYVIARDPSFPGYSAAEIGSQYGDIGSPVAAQWGGWFLLEPRVVITLRSAIDEFVSLINQQQVREKEIHDFFLRNPEFLYRSEFERLWHEPQLPMPDVLTDEFIERVLRPDFVLGGRTEVDPLCLVEVKLPGVELLVDDARHLSASVTKGIAQLRRYKRYFESAMTLEQRRRAFGTANPFPRCILLIGRLPQHQREQIALARVRANELPGVHLLTYDDVVSFQQRRLAELA